MLQRNMLSGICLFVVLTGLIAINGQEGEDMGLDSSSRHARLVFTDGIPKLFQAKRDTEEEVDPMKEVEEELEDRRRSLKDKLRKYKREHPGFDDVDLDDLLVQTDSQIAETLPEAPSRSKRMIVKNPARRWDDAEVPYVFSSTLSADAIVEIQIAFSYFERHSCIRFVPYNSAVHTAGFANFITGYPCSSLIGNYRRSKGQTVRCCTRGNCVHELGHLLGMPHEHQNPVRDGYIRVNWNNIQAGTEHYFEKLNPDDYINYGYYDATSILHYFPAIFNEGTLDTYTNLVSATGSGREAYYELFEVSDAHNCKALKCPNFNINCVNEGFVSYNIDKCVCMCPYGLDPATGCSTILTAVADGDWPTGSYSFMAPSDGCPSSFSTGEVTQWSEGASSYSDPLNLMGEFFDYKTTTHYCNHDEGSGDGDWPSGSYCMHRRGGDCPVGFTEGSIQFGDSSASNYGDLPDGTYSTTGTLFQYCCRSDGLKYEEYVFPHEESFTLYRYIDDCPDINGMYLSTEWMFYDNDNSTTSVTMAGDHPDIFEYNGKYRSHVCHYTPLNMNCGGIIELDDANPTAVVSSPNYPCSYPTHTECNWVIKGPEGSTIIMDFDDFDVESTSTSACISYLNVRAVKLAQPGIQYCGQGIEKSVRSLNNSVGLTFRSGPNDGHRTGFRLTAKLVKGEDMCYDVQDNGRTYRGLVDYGEDMKPCLSWTEMIAYNCTYSSRDPRYAYEGLDLNLCRNPLGNGLRPWCYTGYTENNGCLRSYCDACGQEKLYNTQPNCDSLVAQESGFCDANPGVCARTCSTPPAALPQVSELGCNAPTIPSDGELVGTSKTSYDVGETVTIKCSSFPEQSHDYPCLSDGTWDIGNYVCGLCPDGWTVYKDSCYKYFPEFENQAAAVSRCTQFGAKLATPKAEEEHDFVISLREPTRNMWLGATDLQTERTYKWVDNNEALSNGWQNWASGQPNHKGGKDCASLQGMHKENKWKVNNCRTNYLTFVCEVAKPAGTACVDRRGNCEEMFDLDHQLCNRNADFILQECAQTCGKCNGGSSDTCAVDAPNDYTQVLSSSTIDHGKVAEYSCSAGTELTSGSLHRLCVGQDTLSGDEPICLPSAPTAINSVEMISRSSYGSTNYMYTGQYSDFTIPYAGEITSWEFFSKNAGEVALQVWRWDNDDTYKFIGQNIIAMTTADIAQTVTIEAGQRIQVLADDVIGVYFGDPNGQICYDYCDANTFGQTMKSVSAVADPTTLVPGSLYDFSNSSLYCRRFSLSADVQATNNN